MKKYPGFILRTVRNGRIKFDNQWWIPGEPTNRLNGKRFAFGIYVEGCHSHPVKRLDLLCLWGSEAAYKASCRGDDELYNAEYEKDKLLLAPDGCLCQYWWEPALAQPK